MRQEQPLLICMWWLVLEPFKNYLLSLLFVVFANLVLSFVARSGPGGFLLCVVGLS